VKILQLCHRVPFPFLDGGNIAMYQIGKSLAGAGHDLKILALNTRKHYVSPGTLPAWFTEECALESIDIDTSVKLRGVILNLFQSSSYNITRFYSSAFEKKLSEVLTGNSYDIIQLESLFMTPYLDVIRKHTKAKVVMRAHNVEHVIWQRLADSEKPGWRKWYYRFLVKRLKKFETGTLKKLDAILAITPDDKEIFRALGFNGPVAVIPVSIDLPGKRDVADPFEQLCLFHLGSMDWLPNIEGVNWFLSECWPLIHQEHPNLKLFLAGRGFPDSIRRKKIPNVICEGEIVDAAAYMDDKPIMIVPLLSGSGMRVKIIQGMAAGKVILSTAIGAEGIECMHGKNILIADSPGQMAEAVSYCLANKESLHSISREAQHLVAEKYTVKAIGEKLDGFYKKIIS
jgi:glycosyltransferase involved in cell wall biosynthesis